MGKPYAKIALAGIVIGFAMFFSASLAENRSIQSFIEGAENGFDIDGMYASAENDGPTMSILSGEDIEWQIVDDDGNAVDGTISATWDPNSFDLVSNDGRTCGTVRIVYASRDGMDGVLYVSHDIGNFKMRRTHRVPAFVNE